ncbi:MAG: flagellar hook-length control protein FliK [Pseudomonadota bacterium]
MTPSILAPLTAAPAQLSGPETIDGSASAVANATEGTSFRDLVAQESPDTQGKGDRSGEELASEHTDIDAEYEADQAAAESPDGLSSLGEPAGQGGQALPSAAASVGPGSPLAFNQPASPEVAPATEKETPSDGSRARPAPPTAGTAQTTGAAAPPGTSNAALRGVSILRGDTTTTATRSDAFDSARRARGFGVRANQRGLMVSRNGEGTPTILDGLRPMLGERSVLGAAAATGLGAESPSNQALHSQANFANAATSVTTTNAVPAATAPNAVFTLEASAAASSNPTSFELSQPLGSQAWREELGGRLQWLTDARIGRAELRLNPAELGPLEITLNIRGEEVSASFGAQHAATREAVEQALPRLREMMAQSGLQLADANVGQHSAGGEQSAQSHDRGTSPRPSLRSAQGEDSTVARSVDLTLDGSLTDRANRGQLDLYA